LREFYRRYTRFGFRLILHQYSMSHEYMIEKVKPDDNSSFLGLYELEECELGYLFRVELLEKGGLKYFKCDCYFIKTHGIYCAHMLAVLNFLQIKRTA